MNTVVRILSLLVLCAVSPILYSQSPPAAQTPIPRAKPSPYDALLDPPPPPGFELDPPKTAPKDDFDPVSTGNRDRPWKSDPIVSSQERARPDIFDRIAAERDAQIERMAHDRFVGNIQLSIGIVTGLSIIGFAIHRRKAIAGRMSGHGQQLAVVLSVAALVATWLFPPWSSHHAYSKHQTWVFLFSGDDGSLDTQRLILLDLIIVTIGASAVYGLRQRRMA